MKFFASLLVISEKVHYNEERLHHRKTSPQRDESYEKG